MQTLSSDYVTHAEIWLFTTTLFYFLMNGAQLFETMVLIPKWTANPPESLQMFKGKYAADLKTFWIVTHSLHEVTFIAAIGFCWQIGGIRNALLILFVIHFAVRVWTIGYFAPNIIEFQKIVNGEAPQGDNLLSRTQRWKHLNYMRVGIFVAVSLELLALCIQLMNMR